MDLYATDIEKIRQGYIESLNDVVDFSKQSGSTFNGMRRQDEKLNDLLNQCVKNKDNVRMQRPCNGHFTCTIIGSSSAGKTTFLRELFPDLNDRGWLKTDFNDTTSQSMVIEYSQSVKPVEIESYSYEDLKRFFEMTQDYARNGGVYYEFDDQNQTIHVNAEGIVDTMAFTDAKKSQFEEIKQNFKFEKNFDLKPFETFTRDGNDSSDVESLTTMDATTEKNEETGNNPLQMRALVKEIHLSSDYNRVADLLDSEEDKELVRCIEFIDTPGQGTAGIMKRDESLYYTLYQKPRNIVEQLCRDDELDFMVYQIRVGYQSNFKYILWDKIRPGKVDKDGNPIGIPQEIFSELEQRFILLLNQTSAFITNLDLKRRVESTDPEERDHIDIYIKTNILDQFLGADTLPSAICFIDTLASAGAFPNTPEGRENASQKCDETLSSMKDLMESWTHSDHHAYQSMRNLNLVSETSGEPFLSNVEHLCKKGDRGQGFFLKTLVDRIKNRGPEMLFKKHLVRSRLIEDFQKIKSFFNAKYNSADGSLLSAGVQSNGADVNIVQTDDDKNKVLSLFAQLNNIEASISRLENCI